MFARLSRLVLALIVVPITASAFVDRTITVKGQLRTLEKEFATVKTETGVVNVPVDSVKSDGYRPGQTVIVYVDVADLLLLNKTFFDSLPSAAETK